MKKPKSIGTQKNNTKIIIVLIIILAIAGAIGVYELLSSSTTTIYLFNGTYSAGTEITRDMLIPTEATTTQVNNFEVASGGKGYITAAMLKDIAGYHLGTDVFAGFPLIKAVTSELGGSPTEMKLTDNNIGMGIPVDNIAVGGPKVRPGAFVNIYVGYSKDQENTEELLIEKVRVLDIIYAQLENDNTKAPEVAGVMVEVSKEESVKLAKAVQFGNVRLGLVKATYEKTGPISEAAINVSTAGGIEQN